MNLAKLAFSLALSASFAAPLAYAQQPAPSAAVYPVQSFYLRYATTPAEQNEIVTAIRNTASPTLKIFVVPSRNEIVARPSPDDLKVIEKMLADLDKPQKLYRLTYTFTESDAGKRIGLTRYTIVLVAGQRTQMKQGSRVPVVTGGANTTNTQMTYLDVGMNFDSQIDDYGNSVRLHSKVEQSSMADEKSAFGSGDPVIRQTLLEGVSVLPLGKSLPIGTLDIVGSTRRIEVAATVEQEMGG